MNDTEARTDIVVTRVDNDGVWAKGTVEGVYDVLFDGRRIWSFWLLRDSGEVEPTEQHDATRLAKWPGSLKRYLDGHAHLVVREHVGEEVAFDAEVQFGTADQTISVTDQDGRPLATDKTGELHRVFAGGDERDRDALLDTIEDVLSALDEIGIGAFPAYGTLLGAVRNQKLIGHDSDADLAYVSDYTTPVDLIVESYRIDRHLRSHGYSVQRHSAFAMKIYVEEADGSERGLDVFGAAFVDDRLYVMGEIGIEFDRAQVYPLGTCTLEGRTLPAPADADAWLEITYGPSWKVPDPAFHFGTPQSTRRRLNGWFRGTRRFRDDWDGYWQRNHPEPNVASTAFTRWVRSEDPDADVIVDIGSGRGVDVMWHASEGRRAIGLDYSHSALRHARGWAERLGHDTQFEMLNLCDMRSVLSVGSWISRLPGKRAITARLLTCSLDRRGRKNFWRLCGMAARDGSKVYLQIVDPEQPFEQLPYRRLLRPVRPGTVAEEIEASGGHILDQTVVEPPEGSDDRPRYTRMVVTWEKYASDSAL